MEFAKQLENAVNHLAVQPIPSKTTTTSATHYKSAFYDCVIGSTSALNDNAMIFRLAFGSPQKAFDFVNNNMDLLWSYAGKSPFA